MACTSGCTITIQKGGALSTSRRMDGFLVVSRCCMLPQQARPHLRPRLEDGREKVAVPVFVLAPVLEVLEQRVQLVVRVALQVGDRC